MHISLSRSFSLILLPLLPAGWLPAVVSTNQKIESKPAAMVQAVPTIDGEIVALFPSPDYSCVALLLQEGKPEENRLSLAIFDPDKRRIIAETLPHQKLGNYERKLYWSNDSQWVSAEAEGNKLILLSKRGVSRTLQAGRDEILEICWRGDKPNCLVMMNNPSTPRRTAPNYLKEINIETGAERKLPLKRAPQNLFIVHGKPWICYLNKDNATVVVAQADPWQRKFNIPLTNPSKGVSYFLNSATWDFGGFEVSPDGKYFYLSLVYSAAIRGVIARVSDAGSVLREPWRAVLWHDGYDSFEVDWLQNANGKKKYDPEEGDLAIVYRGDNQSDDFPLLLQLITGSNDKLMWNPCETWRKFRQVVLWRPSYFQNEGANHYLVLTEKGLETFSDNNEPPPALLLRHKIATAATSPD